MSEAPDAPISSDSPPDPPPEPPTPERGSIRVGIDVGGTFTDAVAVDAGTRELIGQVKVPTTHHHDHGVAAGIMQALERLLETVGRTPQDVAFLAHGTTQATNALLEGDVATVGVIGIGRGIGAAFTKRLRTLGRIELAPGRNLPVTYAHVRDAADTGQVGTAIDTVLAGGAEVVVPAEPFSVDAPEAEDSVAEAVRAGGRLATTTHDITHLYGLRRRARTAVVNASILPRMLATADVVQWSIDKAGITAPLMVMRCDGGVMSLDEMRHRPLLTVLSGPAAGVAGALMSEKVSDGIFLETGGTSTDISVIRGGQVVIQYAVVGGKPTYLSALDVRTVGVGGGSMIRVGRGRVTSVGPRSAHIAGLRYACFAEPAELADARVISVTPVPGDPADYLALETATGRFAVTMTCAANASGLIGEDQYARADQESARIAMAAVAEHLGIGLAEACSQVLDAGVAPVRAAVDTLVRDYGLDREQLTLVGGGGGAAAVTPHLGTVTGMNQRIAAHAEVISPLGVALALVREQVERMVPNAGRQDVLAVRAEAEAAVIAQGAAPAGVEVDVSVDPRRNIVRAVATGATEMRTAVERDAVGLQQGRAEAARSLRLAESELTVLAQTPQFTVFGSGAPPAGVFDRAGRRRGRNPVRIVDADGVVRLGLRDAGVATWTVGEAMTRLPALLRQHMGFGDGGAQLPGVRMLLGPRVVDLHGVSDLEQLLALADTELRTRADDEPVVAVVESRL
ncbi:hydantoinase/oxoprolinase family protein [Actinoalloteichus hymeniacidonis]|uniref:N-methylhydantoinase A/acetone carboxylase, beta subunit n=1 Tax=Actinoalloteichus hymeniacidonis TaxID=340345 RepID=A0AAC9MYS2_9PSEU|nr:hydantoinase/oxoprolinase family protein [Actinoalloteichus hymeniacidonis]AOS63749.1 N-methylhydantoinase A/acetone carboxylase, beta subunit [Actinoalloteichus hymeniacidonis]MBB5908197.1 N-methylhydantoinase A/oxoprolinase/acetone carboxylase beta subunit [Actinoalloteichus hymeniacidonis]